MQILLLRGLSMFNKHWQGWRQVVLRQSTFRNVSTECTVLFSSAQGNFLLNPSKNNWVKLDFLLLRAIGSSGQIDAMLRACFWNWG